MKPERLMQFARRLELNAATRRVLSNLFPDHQNGEDAGRYRFMHSAVQSREDVLDCLLCDDYPSQRNGLELLLSGLPEDVTFLHGLAVMFREEAIRIRNSGACDGRLETLSAALWGIVFCSGAFWQNLSGRHSDLDAMEQNELIERVSTSILAPLSALGSQAYAAEHFDSSGMRFKCIEVWRKTPKDLVAILKEFKVSFPDGKSDLAFLNVDEAKVEIMNRTASSLLDDFAATLVEEANQCLEQGIDRLPAGIRKNYESAIKHLQPFLGFDIDDKRIYNAVLTYYADWCYDLYIKEARMEEKALMAKASPIVARLASICDKGQAYLPENSVLSRHYMLKGFYEDDESISMRQYRIALEWDPTNENAEKLLNEKLIGRELQPAYEALKNGNHSKALNILNAVDVRAQETSDNVPPSYQSAILMESARARFRVHVDRAFSHARSESFDSAAEDLKQAMDYAYHPDDQVDMKKSWSLIMAMQAVSWVNKYPYDSDARQEAKKQLTEALEIDPDNDYAKDNLSKI